MKYISPRFLAQDNANADENVRMGTLILEKSYDEIYIIL